MRTILGGQPGPTSRDALVWDTSATEKPSRHTSPAAYRAVALNPSAGVCCPPGLSQTLVKLRAPADAKAGERSYISGTGTARPPWPPLPIWLPNRTDVVSDAASPGGDGAAQSRASLPAPRGNGVGRAWTTNAAVTHGGAQTPSFHPRSTAVKRRYDRRVTDVSAKSQRGEQWKQHLKVQIGFGFRHFHSKRIRLPTSPRTRRPSAPHSSLPKPTCPARKHSPKEEVKESMEAAHGRGRRGGS